MQEKTDAFSVEHNVSCIHYVGGRSTERHCVIYVDIRVSRLCRPDLQPSTIPDDYISIAAYCNTSLYQQRTKQNTYEHVYSPER